MQGAAIQALKKGPLEGITVLDFSRVLAGPYCTMVLADLGARVIKIEKFGTGDDTRAFGPFVDGESAYFMCFNRGKESIVLISSRRAIGNCLNDCLTRPTSLSRTFVLALWTVSAMAPSGWPRRILTSSTRRFRDLVIPDHSANCRATIWLCKPWAG